MCTAPWSERCWSDLKSLVRDDLDAETGEPLVVVHRRSQIDDRCHAEIAQYLRADADFAPLPVAVGLGRAWFADRLHGHAGRAIAQIDEDTAVGLLEVLQHGPHACRTCEKVFYDVG